MKNFNIIGSGTSLPGEAIGNEQLAALVKIEEEWIDYFIGTKTRYFSVDLKTGKKISNLTTLCVEAANKAIVSADIKLGEIDAIVLATATPDHLMPTTVNLIADALGINNITTVQIQSGCSGAIQALDFAYHLMASKNVKNILIIAGDVCNKFINIEQDFSGLSSKEIINYVLFGDGAGALILSSEKNKQGLYIDYIINRFTGLHKPPGQIINWFANEKEMVEYDKPITSEDYKEIERCVPGMTHEVLDELMTKMQWTSSELSYFLPPQLSKNMTDKIIYSLKKSDLNLNPEFINGVEYTGNNGNALAFIQIDQLRNKIKANQKAVLISIESSKWIKSGVSFHG